MNGKQILGEYPNDLTDNGPLNIGKGRGRMIPSTPWDSVWYGIAQWMGVESEADLDTVLPNRDSFPDCVMFTDQVLFKDGVTPGFSDCAPSLSPSMSAVPSTSPSLSLNPSLSVLPSEPRH